MRLRHKQYAAYCAILTFANSVWAVGVENANQSEFRTWADNTGKHTIEASLIDIHSGSAQLKKTDGKVIDVPIEKLSDKDQEYIRDHGPTPSAPQIAGPVVDPAHQPSVTAVSSINVAIAVDGKFDEEALRAQFLKQWEKSIDRKHDDQKLPARMPDLQFVDSKKNLSPVPNDLLVEIMPGGSNYSYRIERRDTNGGWIPWISKDGEVIVPVTVRTHQDRTKLPVGDKNPAKNVTITQSGNGGGWVTSDSGPSMSLSDWNRQGAARRKQKYSSTTVQEVVDSPEKIEANRMAKIIAQIADDFQNALATKLTGRVLYEGKAVSDADVSFYSTNGKENKLIYSTNGKGDKLITKAVTNAEGGFQVGQQVAGESSAMLPGLYRVAIVKYEYVRAGEVRHLLPSKYEQPATSGLTARVVAGQANDFDFVLSEK